MKSKRSGESTTLTDRQAELQAVQWAGDFPSDLKNVRVNHGRLQIPVPKQQLDGSNVSAGREQVGRKRMAQCMNAGMLVNIG